MMGKKKKNRKNVPVDSTNISISKGTHAIFASLEAEANRFSAIALILLSLIIILVLAAVSFVDGQEYMLGVQISMGICVAVSLAMGIYCLTIRQHPLYVKYILLLVWIFVVTVCTTFIDSSVTILWAIPIMLSIKYTSVVFTLMVSVIEQISLFFPFLYNSYHSSYPLDFIVLEKGTVIVMGDLSLDGTINGLETGIDRTKTISNMMVTGYLIPLFLILLLAVIAVSIVRRKRTEVLKQYRKQRDFLDM